MNGYLKTMNRTLAIAVLGVAACTDELSTAAQLDAPLPISADQRAALGRVLDDAVGWLIPALEDPAAAAALREALGEVARQLDEGGLRAFDQSMERADAVLARYDGGGTGEPGGAEQLEDGAAGPDSPLMAMIRLTLDEVAAVARPQRSAGERKQ